MRRRMHNFCARSWRPASPSVTVPMLLACIFLLTTASRAGGLSPSAEGELAAPGFTLEALGGKSHRLADYRGKVVLMNFWASWCPPCLAELPGIQRLADRLEGEAFAVLLVNVGESPFRVSKLLEQTGVGLTSLLDVRGETFKAWGGEVYPTSFVMDTKGAVRYVAQGPLVWDSGEVMGTVSDLLRPSEAAAE